VIEQIVSLIPDIWLGNEAQFANPAEHRQGYVTYLHKRLAASAIFTEEAQRARQRLV
jgi:hypothetical protein